MSEEPRPITEQEFAEARCYSLVIAWSDEDDAFVVVDRPPRYDAARVRSILKRVNVSQSVFAAALNVSPSTVKAWEIGARTPDGPSLRLLELADRRPAALFRALHPANHA